MANTVVGLFDDYDQAQQAVRELIHRGFDRSAISIAANQHAHDLSARGDHRSAGMPPDTSGAGATTVTGEHGMSAGDAAGAGATAGTVIGGVGGLLLGLGLLAIPGLGPLVAAGPIMAMITGAGVGAAAGGLVGVLITLGVPRHQAEHYAEGVRRGGTLIVVSAPAERIDEAADLLDMYGAADINERGGHYQATGFGGYDENAGAYTRDDVLAEQERWRAAKSGISDCRAVTAGSSIDESDPNSARLGSEQSSVDYADAQAHAETHVGELENYLDPSHSHVVSFVDSLSDTTRSTR